MKKQLTGLRGDSHLHSAIRVGNSESVLEIISENQGEEELKELDSMDDNYILESFNERCDIIDGIHDKYNGVITHEEITQKINEEFKRRGIECKLK